jgi:hypothetical protein
MRPPLIFALMLAALLAAGCGLPSPYYLSPPAAPSSSASPTTPLFSVTSTTDNSEAEFRGFELYYKCYLSEADIESNFGISSFESTLRSAGFLPVCSEDDTSPSGHIVPLVPIDAADRGKSFTITVDFNTLGPGTYPATYHYTRPDIGTTVSKGVRRYVPDTAVTCKGFDFAEFLTTDADYSRIGSSVPPGGPFYIAIYALSYGVQDKATPIWSWPVYLGYVGIRT